MKSSGEIDCHFYQVIVNFPFNIKAGMVGGKGAEIIAGLLKEAVLHETIMAKEGISFCEGEGVCLRAWVLWGRRWMQRG